MAFDEKGFLLNGNRVARYLFEYAFVKAGVHFDEIFMRSFPDVLGMSARNQLIHLQDLHGSSFAVRVSIPGTMADCSSLLLQPVSLPRQKESTRIIMVQSDPVMKNAINEAEKALRFRVPIHIHGETGTGKEILARYLHEISGVKGKFIAVNCANLNQSLAESELFGYTSGAFTGAERGGSQGLILQANGGTLFLDEIGDMPAPLQATLLRFLDDWSVRPVGGLSEQRVEINLITATNRDLNNEVKEKKFREDLWYRINTIEVHIPPLRERSDFQEIVDEVTRGFASPLKLEPGALEELQRVQWPGNIRQLKSFLVRLFIRSKDGIILEKDVQSALDCNSQGAEKISSQGRLRDSQRNLVRQAYEQLDGNVSAVARKLGISRNTVYKNLDPGNDR